jgi:hypothetical protein
MPNAVVQTARKRAIAPAFAVIEGGYAQNDARCPFDCQGYSCVVVTHKPDFIKLSTRDLLARRRGLAARLGDLEQVLLGSVVEQTRRCGKASCQCASGDRHGPYFYLTPRRGRAGMRYVPAALMPVVRSYLLQGQQVEAVLAEISAINVELLARRELAGEGIPAGSDLLGAG